MPPLLLPFRSALMLAALCLLLYFWSTKSQWVEQYYSRGLYPFIGNTARRLLGSLPFSVGDVLYALLVIGALTAVVQAGIKYHRGLLRFPVLANGIITSALTLYFLFQLLWGLNYSRQSAAVSFGIRLQPYTNEEVLQLTQVLQIRLNDVADRVKDFRFDTYHQHFHLKTEAIAVYKKAETRYPSFQYRYPSIKPSLYSGIGKYFGFTGYYNPFSGEAQIKTSIPPFLKPFVVLHEVAHQVGYAKEMEANFTAYLVGKEGGNDAFMYSVYFEMWLYAISEVTTRLGPDVSKRIMSGAHPVVLQHRLELRQYLAQNKNRIEPFISFFYDKFLKLNRQPQGMMSYNAVVGWLVAYSKKYGTGSL